MSASRRRGLVAGILFAALGVIFLLEALEVFTLQPATLWPLLFVVLGVAVLAGIGDAGEDDSNQDLIS